jgi:hypothetical protein
MMVLYSVIHHAKYKHWDQHVIKWRKQYSTTRKVQKFNRKIIETEATYILPTNKGGVKLVLLAKTSHLSEMMRQCKFFTYVSKMQTLTKNWVTSVVIKEYIYLLKKKNIFILHDADVILYILIPVLKKEVDGFNHHLDLRYKAIGKKIPTLCLHVDLSNRFNYICNVAKKK